jgi:Ca2+-binding RTX toxin-like protein
MYGDAWYMSDSTGGNDILIGGTGTNYMFGDAEIMEDKSKGGNDILFAGTGNNYMYGDSNPDPEFTSADSIGGNDRLITTRAGEGSTFELTGGGGHDVFVTGKITDPSVMTITDYTPGEDTIAGALNKDYRTTSTTNNANEQIHMEQQLNALILKGKAK